MPIIRWKSAIRATAGICWIDFFMDWDRVRRVLFLCLVLVGVVVVGGSFVVCWNRVCFFVDVVVRLCCGEQLPVAAVAAADDDLKFNGGIGLSGANE